MNHPLVEIEHLNVAFKQYTRFFKQETQVILQDISLTLYAGEILAIFGASGSGKSLLAHACLGLLPENAIVGGDIRYTIQSQIYDSPDKLRGKEISFVPQTIQSLNPLQKIKDQLDIPVNKNSHQLRKFVQDIENFGLDASVLNQYPGQLSGGMARKVLVAMSLMNHPHIIIADEPTPGMDSVGLDYIVRRVKEERNKGVGAMLITHDIQTALRVADRIAIFHQGQVIEMAYPYQFSGKGDQLHHPYSRALWMALPENGFCDIK